MTSSLGRLLTPKALDPVTGAVHDRRGWHFYRELLSGRAELNVKGELIGIEILDASTYVRDTVLESAQAKMLSLSETKTA